MELFTEKDAELGAEAGTIITENSFFEVKNIDEGLIEVRIQNSDGKESSVIISN